jgi:signal transduction histidine kinase/CheY-like chemotaxis protein
MKRRLTLHLIAGLLTVAVALALVVGSRSYFRRQADCRNLGSQNALLGAHITQFILEKAVANGLFDREALFRGRYDLIDDRGQARYRTEYDRFFDQNVGKILKAFEANADIYYAYVVNNDGFIPAHTDAAKNKTMLSDPSAPERKLRPEPYDLTVTCTEGYSFSEYHAPIFVEGQPWGEFRVGIPAAMAHNRGREIAVSTLCTALFFSLLIVGVMVWLLEYNLRPLQELTRATRQMAAGDVSARCNYGGSDELGTLAQSFNGMAETISRTQEGLERVVRERTAQLADANQAMLIEIAERTRAEESLRVAKEAAESANRAKSEFLANTSHEIRTPMTAILGFADVLAATVDKPEQQEAIQTIKRNSNHLLGLINDILDLSKIEAGKVQLEPLPTSPLAILGDVVSLMRVRADAKGLHLKLEYGGPIPQRIHVDPSRLRQILVNLVGNAIKFTETGQVTLTAQLLDRDTQAPTFQCQVIDTGMGISPEQLAGLFQPFQQADSSVTRKFGGTGLGLAISKRLARLLGGDITVASALGQGSVFTLTFTTGPLDGIEFVDEPTEAMATSVSAAQTPKSSVPQIRLEGRRILLAEDGPDNQRLISFILKKAGAEVVVCENGRKAMESALCTLPGYGRRFDDCTLPFDLVLMDMQMPVMDGYEATRQLRQRGYTAPILALTAHAMKDDRQKCLDAGCDAYLTKPIVREEFLSTLTAHLKHPAPAGADVPQAAQIQSS